jgi:hypothetical protein
VEAGGRRALLVARERVEPEERDSQAGRAVEPALALLARRRQEDRRRELARDAEREAPLELGAARAADEHAGFARQLGARGDDRRLADPRRPANQDRPAATVAHVAQRAAQRLQLSIALQQRLRAHLGDSPPLRTRDRLRDSPDATGRAPVEHLPMNDEPEVTAVVELVVDAGVPS